VRVMLKKAMQHDGLARGLHEAARAVEKGWVGALWACPYAAAPALQAHPAHAVAHQLQFLGASGKLSRDVLWPAV